MEQTNGCSSIDGSSDPGILKDVLISFPLEKIASLCLDVTKALEKFFNSVSSNAFPVSCSKIVPSDYTYVDISVNKIKVQAIVDSGAPCNIISSKLVKKLGLQPDLDYDQEYGTAGTEKVRSLGAYSALPMKFGQLFLSSLAIVLPNCNYEILIGTSLLH